MEACGAKQHGCQWSRRSRWQTHNLTSAASLRRKSAGGARGPWLACGARKPAVDWPVEACGAKQHGCEWSQADAQPHERSGPWKPAAQSSIVASGLEEASGGRLRRGATRRALRARWLRHRANAESDQKHARQPRGIATTLPPFARKPKVPLLACGASGEKVKTNNNNNNLTMLWLWLWF